MPPKKAAKKVAKKAAKKVPAKHAGRAAKDVRRAYEHMGRVQLLVTLLEPEQGKPVQTLGKHAEQSMQAGDVKSSADLLRAAEHYAFGTIALDAAPDESLSETTLTAVREEYEHLRARAAEHGEISEAPRSVAAIAKRMSKGAAAAMKSKLYRAALELARGAEALAHVKASDERNLGAGSAAKRLER